MDCFSVIDEGMTRLSQTGEQCDINMGSWVIPRHYQLTVVMLLRRWLRYQPLTDGSTSITHRSIRLLANPQLGQPLDASPTNKTWNDGAQGKTVIGWQWFAVYAVAAEGSIW
jgi:hypothetical protein